MENNVVKIETLSKFLECNVDDIEEDWIEDNRFSCGNTDYLVYTDAEADDAVNIAVQNSLWAFNTDFILSQCGLPHELEEVFSTFQQEKCEDANDAILALVEKTCGLGAFVEAVVAADGRGHFLAVYDSHENEVQAEDGTYLYIYRV